MLWTKISPEVHLENDVYVLPYIQGVDGHVEMFGTPDRYASISFVLAVKKGFLGMFPFWDLPLRYDEMVFFLCTDWTTWHGLEVGFRFPLHLGATWYTIYVQYWRLLFEVPFHIDTLDEFHEYRIEFNAVASLTKTTFSVDDDIKWMYLLRPKDKPFLPVLTTHTRYTEDFGFNMRLKSASSVLSV